MLEKAKLPEKAEQIIKKIEQFLQIRLTKISDTQKFLQTKKRLPVLLDNEGKELNKIPEPKIKKWIKEKEPEEELIDNFLEGAEIEMKKSGREEINDRELRFAKTTENSDIKKPRQELVGLNMEKGEFDISRADLSMVKINELK